MIKKLLIPWIRIWIYANINILFHKLNDFENDIKYFNILILYRDFLKLILSEFFHRSSNTFINDKWKLIKYLIIRYNEMQLNYLK